MIDFDTMWQQQRTYSRLLSDVGEMSDQQRATRTREMGHDLHGEVSRLVDHVGTRHRDGIDVDRQRLLSTAVDLMRYGMAVCNLWDFTVEQFTDAWNDRELHLQELHRIQTNRWDGRLVVICDIDDVLAEFRHSFISWIMSESNVIIDINDPQFYLVDQLAKTGVTTHEYFARFVRQRHIAKLPRRAEVDVVNSLHDRGVWIHLVTARPADNVSCVHDTFRWLKECDVRYDDITFATEKVTFVTNTPYHSANAIVACIEDSPRHVVDYTSHGITTIMPSTSYNASVNATQLLHRYSTVHELDSKLTSLLEHFVM